MSLTLGLALLVQAAAPAAMRAPVLAFPEPGLDDTAAYQGYATGFYRDSRDNSVQVYLEARSGRVVNLWADAANESLGFTARDGQGRPPRRSRGVRTRRWCGIRPACARWNTSWRRRDP